MSSRQYYNATTNGVVSGMDPDATLPPSGRVAREQGVAHRIAHCWRCSVCGHAIYQPDTDLRRAQARAHHASHAGGTC